MQLKRFHNSRSLFKPSSELESDYMITVLNLSVNTSQYERF